MSDYLDTLSDFVARTHFDDLSADVVSAVKDVVLDTLGVIVAGSHQSENAALSDLAGQRSGPATATILGHNRKAEPMLATLANATAGAALEMDEANFLGGARLAIHTIPGALAVAEEMGLGGRRLIESILVSYELGSRIGGSTRLRSGVNPQTDAHWMTHPNGPFATISTAAAVAKLKGYPANQIRDVINLAASMSPANTWDACFEGATVRNVLSGRAGLQGILAVHLYECGYTGLEDGPMDTFGSILGQSFDPEAAIAGLGAGEYRIQKNTFKFHACCGVNFPVLDATLEACSGEGFAPEDVKAIDIMAPSVMAQMLGPYPRNPLAAKFHLPYSVAAAVARGGTSPSSFDSEAIADRRIRDLTGRVQVHVDAEAAKTSDGTPATKVLVRLGDGRTLEGSTTSTPGKASDTRVSREALTEKFHLLTDDILGLDGAKAAIDVVDRLEQLTDVREMTALFGG